VEALLGVNSWSWIGENERYGLTLYSAIMVQLWKRNKVREDNDKNNEEDTSRYEKSVVSHAWMGCEDLLSVTLHAESGLIPTLLGVVHWFAHYVLLSSSFSRWFPPFLRIALFLVLNSTITWKQKVKSSLSISAYYDQEFTPSIACTVYSIHPVLHHPKIDCLTLPASLSSLSRPYCTEFTPFQHLPVYKWIDFQLLSHLPPEPPPPDWPPSGTPPN